MSKNVELRAMSIDEIHRISELDVSESGNVVYKLVDGTPKAVPENWRRPSSYGEEWKQRADRIQAGLQRGGIAFGAFDGERLIGFVALQYRLADTVAALLALWVSAGYRHQAVASRLVREAIAAARSDGATAVYSSTCPSESAYGFYRSQGFAPTAFVHRELYELEPEDIHMILNL